MHVSKHLMWCFFCVFTRFTGQNLNSAKVSFFPGRHRHPGVRLARPSITQVHQQQLAAMAGPPHHPHKNMVPRVAPFCICPDWNHARALRSGESKKPWEFVLQYAPPPLGSREFYCWCRRGLSHFSVLFFFFRTLQHPYGWEVPCVDLIIKIKKWINVCLSDCENLN